jgi:hypothetical protein
MNDGQGDPLPVFIGAASLEIRSERARAGDDTIILKRAVQLLRSRTALFRIMDRRGGME